jgi:hypothetical protein
MTTFTDDADRLAFDQYVQQIHGTCTISTEFEFGEPPIFHVITVELPGGELRSWRAQGWRHDLVELKKQLELIEEELVDDIIRDI